RQKIYKDLAHEAVFSHPILFLRIALGKIISSANPGEFRAERFLPSYYIEKYGHQYEADREKKPGRIRRIFGLPKDAPLPDYSEFQRRLAPEPDSTRAGWLFDYVSAYHAAAKLVVSDDEDDPTVDLTPLAWWVLSGCALAFLPFYARRLGIPVLMGVSYLFCT